MVAYNHFIGFVPALNRSKPVSSPFSQIVTVRAHPPFEFAQRFSHKITFLFNQGRDVALYADKPLSPAVAGDTWGYEIEGIALFFWTSGTRTLYYVPQKRMTEQLLEYWTLHIVLPLFFTIEETYDFLHAGAVEVEGMPILFVAESYGGKSTMTDFFLKQGHTLVSDDKVATYEEDGVFFGVASIPFHRPYRKLEDLGYFVDNIARTPKPIHALYELERAGADADITIEELHGLEKFKALRYSSEFNFSFLKPKRFAYLTRLAKAVPVYRVSVPWDMNRLPEVHQAILDHAGA